MLLKECYEAFGGNYEAVSQRIPKEAIIRKFALMFLNDPSYKNLCEALKTENNQEAFRAVHSLKGVSANLGFEQLEKSSSNLTELLRNCEDKQVDVSERARLFEELTKDYQLVVEVLNRLDS